MAQMRAQSKKHGGTTVRQLIRRLTAWITLNHQKSQAYRTDARAHADIRRIASLSPHLLEDLGFENAPSQQGAEIQVWTRGAMTVTIFERPGGTDPLIDVTLQEKIDKT